MKLKRGNVVIDENGKKKVVWKERELDDSEKFFSKKAHEDEDMSYFCTNEYCRCRQ
jgi:hypothetical protein